MQVAIPQRVRGEYNVEFGDTTEHGRGIRSPSEGSDAARLRNVIARDVFGQRLDERGVRVVRRCHGRCGVQLRDQYAREARGGAQLEDATWGS